MLLDNEVLVLDGVAYNASAISTPVGFNLGTARPGPGEKITMLANCGGADMAGLTAIAITDCDTLGGSYTAALTITVSAAEINAGNFFFQLPAHIRQYCKFAWTSISAGTAITLGVVMDEQTNL